MERKFSDLVKLHDQLQVQRTKDLLKFPLVDAIATMPLSTNPCCEHASLLEENAQLKAQLEKGLATCIQGEKP